MRDLVAIYAEARFGKAAADDIAAADPQGIKAYLTMPQLNENTLAIRNAIEASVRQEQRLKSRAKALTEHARYRLTEAPKAGVTGQVSDLVRALIPGLSPAASTEGIKKVSGLASYTTPEAEKKYDTLHALAAGGGAGLGAAYQRGLLTTAGGQGALGRLLDRAKGALRTSSGAKGKVDDVSKAMASVLKSTKKVPHDVTQLRTLARSTPKGAKKSIAVLRKMFAAARGKADPAALTGAQRILPAVARAGTLRGKLGTLMSVLRGKGVPAAAATRTSLLSTLGTTTKKLGLGGWKGAMIGAAIATLPFALRRWYINRKMRAQGGRAASEAATTAEANLAAAEKLQGWRQKQLQQLEQAVGPEAPAWAAPAAPEAPEAAPAPAPASGPFGRYKLTPFQQ